MRILHIADPHIKLTGPRSGECRRVLDWVADNATSVEPALIILPGDVFDSRSTPEERLYLAGFLSRLAAVAPVRIIGGNHDNAEDLELFGIVDNVRVYNEPSVERVVGGALAFLPWPNLGALAAAIGAGASISDRREIARAALVDVLRGFRGQVHDGERSLLVAHLPVTGATMDSGQPVAGGDEISLTAEELLESGCAGVALGHIHQRQQMRTADGRPVWYSGAPFRNTFGEASGAKGGLIWDWDPLVKGWRVEPWNTPARDMVLIEAGYSDGVLLMGLEDEIQRDSEIRVVVTFKAEDRDAAAAAASEFRDHLLAGGALSVAFDLRPVIISRTRCVEITKAQTPWDKLQAWAAATEQEIPATAETRVAELDGGRR